MSTMDNSDMNPDIPSNISGFRIPLSRTECGKVYEIVKVSGKDETKKHLGDMGFVVGCEVVVINQVSGNLVCEIKGVRVGLDTTLASRITVIETKGD